MTKREKRRIIFAVIAAILIFILVRPDMMLSLASFIGSLLLPIAVGLVVAFILDVPVSAFEKLIKKLTAKKKKPLKEKTIHNLSIVLTILCLLLVVALVCTLVIPEVVQTVKSISGLVKASWPKWMEMLETLNIDTTQIKDLFASFNIEEALKGIANSAGTLIGSIASATTSTVSTISAAVIGTIISIYVLIDRDTLLRQSKKMIYAYTKEKTADKICYVCDLIKSAYAKFLSGQCIESLILGMLIFIAFAIFRLPYAGLIGIVTAVCSLIPYIGAFISCALGVFLAFLDSPQKALICLVVYLAVQFIETQFIYPHVVGGSVGLSPLWTLISVLVGGNLFGLIGMIFFIPLVSVIYTLVKEDTDKKLETKKNLTSS